MKTISTLESCKRAVLQLLKPFRSNFHQTDQVLQKLLSFKTPRASKWVTNCSNRKLIALDRHRVRRRRRQRVGRPLNRSLPKVRPGPDERLVSVPRDVSRKRESAAAKKNSIWKQKNPTELFYLSFFLSFFLLCQSLSRFQSYGPAHNLHWSLIPHAACLGVLRQVCVCALVSWRCKWVCVRVGVCVCVCVHVRVRKCECERERAHGYGWNLSVIAIVSVRVFFIWNNNKLYS